MNVDRLTRDNGEDWGRAWDADKKIDMRLQQVNARVERLESSFRSGIDALNARIDGWLLWFFVLFGFSGWLTLMVSIWLKR